MLIHSTEVVTGKKNHDFNKEQAHTHATNVSRILPAPKEKKQQFLNQITKILAHFACPLCMFKAPGIGMLLVNELLQT